MTSREFEVEAILLTSRDAASIMEHQADYHPDGAAGPRQRALNVHGRGCVHTTTNPLDGTLNPPCGRTISKEPGVHGWLCWFHSQVVDGKEPDLNKVLPKAAGVVASAERGVA